VLEVINFVKLFENQAIMIQNDVLPCLFIQTVLHILCTLFEPKINFSLKEKYPYKGSSTC